MELVNPAGKAFFSLRKSLTGCQPVYTEQKAALDREWWIHKGFWYLVAFPICSARQYEILCQKKKECPGTKAAHQDCCRGAGPSAWWCLIGTPSRLHHLISSLINQLDKSTGSKLCLTLAKCSKCRASSSFSRVGVGSEIVIWYFKHLLHRVIRKLLVKLYLKCSVSIDNVLIIDLFKVKTCHKVLSSSQSRPSFYQSTWTHI